ncbi:MAG: WcaF family extracellular polysaccharide biosynthesis acetyltransferase [Verrucomicrobiota bacterium]
MMDLLAYEATKPGFDRGAPRWKERLWHLIRIFIFHSALPYPSAFKVWLLRRFGAQVGKGVVIHPQVNIKFPWRLQIGDHSWIGEEACLLSLAEIKIGAHCCLSQRSFLCTGSHAFHAPAFDLKVAPITIEDHCWIAAQVFVGKGVSIGQHSLVSTGSVVTENVPPGSYVEGNPATSQPHHSSPHDSP